MTISKRIYWLDYAKAIGIYLVVLGHLPVADEVKFTIYSFHMPLFFFISGYLFAFNKHPNFKSFVTHRAKQLLIPYVALNIITYLFWLFIGRKFGDDAANPIKLYKPLIGIVYGNSNNDYLIHDVVLWFLPALFFVEVVFYLSFRNKSRAASLLLLTTFGVAGYLVYKFCPFYLPGGIDTALTALVFYGLANVFKNEIGLLLNIKVKYLAPLLLAVLILFFAVATTNSMVDMRILLFGNYYVVFLLTAFVGIITMLLVCRMLDIWFGQVAFVQFVAINTIVIFALHPLAFTFIKAINFYIFKYPMGVFNSGLLFNIGMAILAIVLLLPVIWVSNTYFPALVGKAKKTSA
jgi:acyltransferase